MSGNLYLRQMRFENTGDIEIGHTHTYDHITLLTVGSLEVRTDDNTTGTVYKAPSAIKILKGVKHTLIAQEADTLAHCIHALRDAATEDVLPANVVYTDKTVKAITKVDDGYYVIPTDQEATIDGVPVRLANIAKIKGELTSATFNRNLDSNPLNVVLPNGQVEYTGKA